MLSLFKPPLIMSLFYVFLFFYNGEVAVASDADIARMQSRIQEKLATQKIKGQVIAQGKERAVLCNQCHGEDGNSVKPGVPNLAAQNPLYLLEQIEKFSDGRRTNYVMNALSKNFTLDDKENLAIFYANMKVNAKTSNPALSQKGQLIYAKQCSGCHGKKGHGQVNFARLAGQQMAYVNATLKTFRDNSKNNGSATTRNSVIMDAIAQNLTDDDVSALAAYVAQLE